MRILLIVADIRRSATAEGWNGKMANLLRFAPFRGGLKCNQGKLRGNDAKPRKPQKRWMANAAAA